MEVGLRAPDLSLASPSLVVGSAATVAELQETRNVTKAQIIEALQDLPVVRGPARFGGL